VEDIDEIINAIRRSRFVFVCGNGGSASTAEHFTNDLFSKGIRAICLNSNTSIMTMIANDYGYKKIFSKQLEVYSNKEDFVIMFSVSGKSENVVEIRENDSLPMSCMFTGNIGETYQEAENRHLKLAHEIAKSL
jgi:D-sedoheptulose 7-phosphate isomerase